MYFTFEIPFAEDSLASLKLLNKNIQDSELPITFASKKENDEAVNAFLRTKALRKLTKDEVK